ncbi:Lipid binding protein BPI/LBP [Quillaja saponaria]|uniref:Lipid binding protein BPI/LBP n=1 Tax=Quillaja saponaria TaxID=32244 RepID=A0AAD7LMW9_QUISA|nr:Lipid binding protein BPI/LBP [Quillaja saponaria]
MAPTIFFIFLSLLFIPARTHLELNEEGFISVEISDKGLDYAKDVLIDEAISSIIPLQLPQIEKTVEVVLIGKVKMVLSSITIYHVNINSSLVKTGEAGITLVASGATAYLSMNWKYSYSNWLFEITDSGDASVQVKGMEVGLTVDFKKQEEFLKLILLDYGCYVKRISIELHGGASWLYQVVVDAFEGQIASAVEDGISEKVREGISKLDVLLQSLPKQIPIDETAALSVSFVKNPVLSNSSIEFEINGLFTARNEILASRYYLRGSGISIPCSGSANMIKISVNENVFNSASLVYFNADYMQWIVDELPNQTFLNTAKWKYIIPRLYKQYPNADMEFNISLTSPPIIQVVNQDIESTIYIDLILNVLEVGEVIPVACILLEINASGSAEIIRNNLAGIIRVKGFSTHLKWSNIGKLNMLLIQTAMSAIPQSHRGAIYKLAPTTRISIASSSWFYSSEC